MLLEPERVLALSQPEENSKCPDPSLVAKTGQALKLIKSKSAADRQMGLSLYQEAAEAGYTPAQYNLGSLYMGSLVGRDPEKALHWFTLAADAGDFDAMFNIAYIYDRGFLGEQDIDQARLWYARAAQAGSGRAQYDLAAIYQHGRGVAVDLEKALYWYDRARESGVARALPNYEEIKALLQTRQDGPPASED